MQSSVGDVAKSVEVSTRSYMEAVSYDSQILEDKLKYSSQISALGVGSLLMIAANFSDFLSAEQGNMMALIGLVTSVLTITACIVLGGIFHAQVIRQLEAKRKIMTLALKQQSAILSNLTQLGNKCPISDQIWQFQHLAPDDIVTHTFLINVKGAHTWMIFAQTVLLVAGILAVFSVLFLSI